MSWLSPRSLERLPVGDAQLACHQVDVGDLLGDRVLDLDARIHLDEHVVAALVEQELHRARIRVVDLARERDRVSAHLVAQFGGKVWRRREFDDLLVAALHAAVALEQMHHVTVLVGQDLHLDVARVEHRLLEIDHRIAERRLGLAAGRLDGLGQRRRIGHPPHTAPAAAGHRLDEQRELQPRRGRHQLLDRRRRRRGVQHRQAGIARRRDGPGLISRQLKDFGTRTDERDPRIRARRGQLRILRQETVSRVDGIGTGLLRDADDLVDRQVGAHRMAHVADLIRLVGLQPVLGVAVLVRVDRDGGDAHLVGGPESPDRDLTAIGHQDFGYHALPPSCSRGAWTSSPRSAPGSAGSAR